MKARYFTYEQRPKAVYYLTDIKADLYPNHNAEDFFKEIESKWMNKPDMIIVDDRDNTYLGNEIEMINIEKYLNKLEDLRKELDLSDE
jgi:RecA-family ATPase